MLPGSRWKRDGLVVSTLDGVAAVTGVVWRVEDGTLHPDIHLLPLLWKLSIYKEKYKNSVCVFLCFV